MEKREENKKRKFDWIRAGIILCLAVMCFCGYKIFTIWQGSHQIDSETQELYEFMKPGSAQGTDQESEPAFSPDWAGLKAANPNVVAWIIVPGTDISYPVVQGSDNYYYLDHSYTGESSYLGAIFLDAGASASFQNDNSLIFGHTADVGSMFTQLKEYTDEAFFNEHPYFWLLTPEQNYKCENFVFYQGPDSTAVYTADFGDFREEVLTNIQSQALYIHPMDTADASFVTLSTCNVDYGYNSDQRYALMAKLIKWDEPIPVSEAGK